MADSNEIKKEQKFEKSPENRLQHRHRAQSIIQFLSLDQLEDEVTHGYYETVPPNEGSRKRVVAMEMIYGFLWWICFQFYTLCINGSFLLSPWQRILVVFVSFVIMLFGLYVGVVKRLFSTPFGLMTAKILSFMVLVSYQFSEPVLQVLAIGVGGGACVLVIYASLWDVSNLDKYRKIRYHLLGLMLTLSVEAWLKVVDHLNQNPVLMNSTIFVGVVTVVLLFSQDRRTTVLTNDDIIFLQSPKRNIPRQNDVEETEWVWLGVGFGCVLFLAYSVYGERGLLMKWVELNDGMLSLLMHVLVIIVLSTGILLSKDKNLYLICSIQWLTVGLLGYLMFVILSSFTAGLGVLVFSLYFMSLCPQLYRRLTECLPHRVIPVAMVTYIVFILVSDVRVGNYSILNFTVILALTMSSYGLRQWLPLGILLGRVRKRSSPNPVKPLQRNPSYVVVLGHMIRRLSTIIEGDEEVTMEDDNDADKQSTVHKRRLQDLLAEQEEEIRRFEVKKLRKAMIALLIVSLLGAALNIRQ